MSEQDERDERERKRTARETLQAIRPLLLNPDGLRRLREISDEEWQAAADADEAAGDAA